MCGIGGFYQFTLAGDVEPRALLDAMTQALAHRGPDGHGCWLDDDGQIGLGQTRLAIIDLPTGQQPMWSADRRLVIVFNGEIYNYRELRQQLIARGQRFITDSDTEVLMAGYAEWGLEVLPRLRGMFAFAVWDTQARRLLLARDPTGIKPLYVSVSDRGVVFASEIKSILLAGLPRRLNVKALADFLLLGFPLMPDTAFEGIEELPPGSWYEFSPEGRRQGRYWRWRRCEQTATASTIVNEAEQALVTSLSDHLVADVPLGTFLSGGIDSSLIATLLARVLGIKVATFTVQFGEPRYDESPAARLVANHLGLEHHQISLNNAQADLDEVGAILDQFDQPFGDSSAIPTYYLCREIRRHVKVVLGGDGGDEMFGGYTRFHYADVAQHLGRMPRALLSGLTRLSHRATALFPARSRQGYRLLTAAAQPDAARLLRLSCANYPEQLTSILQPDVLARLNGYRPALQAPDRVFASPGGREFVDATVDYTLPGDYLRKVDVMSGAHGLEVRVPFLGVQVLAFSQQLPHSLRFVNGQNKWVLRQLAERYLPPAIAHKSKAGFGIPLDTWLGEVGRAEVGRVLSVPTARLRAIIQPAWIDALVAGFIKGRWDQARWSRYGLYQNVYYLWSLERWLARWQPAL